MTEGGGIIQTNEVCIKCGGYMVFSDPPPPARGAMICGEIDCMYIPEEEEFYTE